MLLCVELGRIRGVIQALGVEIAGLLGGWRMEMEVEWFQHVSAVLEVVLLNLKGVRKRF